MEISGRRRKAQLTAWATSRHQFNLPSEKTPLPIGRHDRGSRFVLILLDQERVPGRRPVRFPILLGGKCSGQRRHSKFQTYCAKCSETAIYSTPSAARRCLRHHQLLERAYSWREDCRGECRGECRETSRHLGCQPGAFSRTGGKNRRRWR